MDSTIVASLISAAASIIVALLSKGGAQTSAPGRRSSTPAYAIPKRNRVIWIIAVCILMYRMGYAALFLHWDEAGMGVLAIPLVMWILSAVFPIQPSSAAAVTLFLFPFAFSAEPIGKWRRGINFENHFEPSVVGAFVSIAFGTAFIAWLIARWRARSYWIANLDEQQPTSSSTLAKGLSELAELHRTGVLSDEEFTRAKNKLLSK
jgi:hypothetical protein